MRGFNVLKTVSNKYNVRLYYKGYTISLADDSSEVQVWEGYDDKGGQALLTLVEAGVEQILEAKSFIDNL